MASSPFTALALVALVASGCSPSRGAYDVPDSAPPSGDALDVGTSADTGTTERYPAGPYDFKVGSVIPNLVFQGYRDGTAPWAEIHLSEHYDPDGTRGVRVILFEDSAAWCPPCNALAAQMSSFYAIERPRGARFVELLRQDVHYKPATQVTVDAWLDKFGLPFDTVIEDVRDSVTESAFPTLYVIDPRTMRIHARLEGMEPGPIFNALEQVLTRNGAAELPPDSGPYLDGGVTPTDGGDAGSDATDDATDATDAADD